MAVVLAPIGVGFQFFGGNTPASASNQPLVGGLLNVYAAGTTTPVTTYTSSSGLIANTNPIVLDASGRVPFEIWWTAGSSYKFVLQDSTGNTIPNGTWDNVPGINDTSSLFPVSAGSVTFTPPGIGAVPTTVAAFLGAFKQYPSGQFFAQDGAFINRLNDRVFIGGATVSDATYPPVTNDWFATYGNSIGYSNSTPAGILYTLTSPSVPSESTVSAQFAAQSLTAVSSGASCIGVESFAINNNSTLATEAWAYYGEAHRTNGTVSNVYGMELDTRNVGGGPSTPSPSSQGNVVALQLASGAGVGGSTCAGSITANVLTVSGASANVGGSIAVGMFVYGVGVAAGTTITSLGTGTGGNGTYNLSATPNVSARPMQITNQFQSSSAIQIQPNVSQFLKGIVFGNTSLAGSDGTQGSSVAIAMGFGHALAWYNSPGNLLASINASATNYVNSQSIAFTDNGFLVSSINSGQAWFYISGATTGATNYIATYAQVTGSTPIVGVGGTDAQIDLALASGGTVGTTSTVKFSSAGMFSANGAVATSLTGIGPTGSHTTVQTWLTIKDNTGTVRYIPCF